MNKAYITKIYNDFQKEIESFSDISSLIKAAERVKARQIGGNVCVGVHLKGGQVPKNYSLLDGLASIKQLPQLKDTDERIIENSCGAIIWYNAQLDELSKWMVICHELGHFLLHYEYDGHGNASRSLDKLPFGTMRETTASYFAKLAALGNPDYRSSGDRIRAMIQKMHAPDYPYKEDWLS